ncbi:MAG TPA: phage holin family protein [Deinococcales bacterium]|nr:phage holin family protein [Deinococcales bacterium]
MQRGFLWRVVVNAVALFLVSVVYPAGLHLADGHTVQNGGLLDFVLAGLVLGLVNALLRPIILILTLPVNLATLGLFTLVVNALMLWVVAAFTNLATGNLLQTIVAAALLSIASYLVSGVLDQR